MKELLGVEMDDLNFDVIVVKGTNEAGDDPMAYSLGNTFVGVKVSNPGGRAFNFEVGADPGFVAAEIGHTIGDAVKAAVRAALGCAGGDDGRKRGRYGILRNGPSADAINMTIVDFDDGERVIIGHDEIPGDTDEERIENAAALVAGLNDRFELAQKAARKG